MEVQVQPTAHELLCVVALLWQENDSLRERVGQCGVQFSQRMFTEDDLRRGASLCPTASIRSGRALEVRMES